MSAQFNKNDTKYSSEYVGKLLKTKTLGLPSVIQEMPAISHLDPLSNHIQPAKQHYGTLTVKSLWWENFFFLTELNLRHLWLSSPPFTPSFELTSPMIFFSHNLTTCTSILQHSMHSRRFSFPYTVTQSFTWRYRSQWGTKVLCNLWLAFYHEPWLFYFPSIFLTLADLTKPKAISLFSRDQLQDMEKHLIT